MASYSTTKLRGDHFVPEASNDPAVQRRLRGQLEQIDYTAFDCNREIIGHVVGVSDINTFKRLAISTATARAQWLAEAVAISAAGPVPSPERIKRLSELHHAYEELCAAYEGMRRLVERGYLHYRSEPKAG
jgi:hypothetical protein